MSNPLSTHQDAASNGHVELSSEIRQTILVFVDLTHATHQELAIALAQSRASGGAELHVLCVVADTATGAVSAHDLAHYEKSLDETRTRLWGLVQQRRSAFPLESEQKLFLHFRFGSAAEVILQLAREASADLIVVGTEEFKGVQKLMHRSVSEQVIEKALCPVLIARAKGYPSASFTPDIEAPCPACIATRRGSDGGQWWCPRHAERHKKAHSYSYSEDVRFDLHDSEANGPTGVDRFLEPSPASFVRARYANRGSPRLGALALS